MRPLRWQRKWRRDLLSDGWSPIPTQIVSNEEYLPTPPTRAQRVPGEACSGFTGESAQQFLLNNPTDPLRMDESRDGIACGGVDGAGFMNPPLRSSPPLPPPRNYQ